MPSPGGWRVTLIAAWSLLISRAKGRTTMDERSKRSQTGTVSAGAHRAGFTQDHRVSDIVREVMSLPAGVEPRRDGTGGGGGDAARRHRRRAGDGRRRPRR